MLRRSRCWRRRPPSSSAAPPHRRRPRAPPSIQVKKKSAAALRPVPPLCKGYCARPWPVRKCLRWFEWHQASHPHGVFNQRRRTMKSANRLLVALVVGLSTGSLASQVSAQGEEKTTPQGNYVPERAPSGLPAPVGQTPANGDYSSSVPAISEKRAAAVMRCSRQALSEYPDMDSIEQGRSRTRIYSACMAQAGETP